MKFRYIIFFLIILATACSKQNTAIKITDTEYSIVISTNADSLSIRAAREIQSYIFKVSHIELKIEHKLRGSKKFIVIGKGILKTSLSPALDTLKEDGFIIETRNQNILIAGNNGKSNLYAAYTFIEEFLGCRMFAEGEEYIPQKKELFIPPIQKIYEPSFAFRRIDFPDATGNNKYSYWHKVESLDDWGCFVHTFQHLVPPEKYFKEHPEYFALIGKHRLSDAQLCLSNPEVIRVLKENLGKEINANPDKTYWSVSQNDCYNYCECEHCKALYEKYGGISGAYIHMANELAEAFPDKQISTLAYQFTRSAPTNITPRKNVNIMFCSIECNRSMPLAKDERCRDFVKDMQDWSRLTHNIFVWDYVVQFENYLTPFPNFHILQPNIRFFHDHRVNMIFEQGSGRNWSDLGELKQYLLTKLLWNKDADVKRITRDFMRKYYGPAAAYIQAYHELAEKSLQEKQQTEILDIYGFPSTYYHSFLSPVLLKKYKKFMDKAEASVAQNSVYLKRVLRTRLPVDFAYLDIALNKNADSLSFFGQTADGNSHLRPDMLEYLDRFVENSKLTATPNINEKELSTDEYRKYALNRLDMMSRKNLAKGKTIKSLTPYSKQYPVGGEKALTDGLYGPLDFHHNWLGFHGQDMVLEVDLHQTESVSRVSMNFLKAINSWVFLPTKLIVEVSMDGKNYSRAASLSIKDTDRSFLVKSLAYQLKFSPVKARYLRVKAVSLKQCPPWHRGFGNPSWIFIDELIIE